MRRYDSNLENAALGQSDYVNVMAGLVPAIHVLAADKDVDARVKPAHDGDSCLCTLGMTRVLP
jgi:hypothetical protein